MRVLLITTPFAIPFTLLYTKATPGVNWFATIGLVLVNLLLYYLSRTNQRSRQRTREMTQLEALGEEIIQAPPDGSTLRELLTAHVGQMFQDPRDILEIRIFEGIELPGFAGDPESLHLVHPAHQSPCPESYWDDLKRTDDPNLIIKDVIPTGTKAVYGNAIIDKITSAVPGENGDAPACIGGVYLLRHKSVAESAEALPAVQALASQVASALYRAQVHAETLSAHKMAQELAFAGQIQASFLPDEVPAVEGWGIAASLTPARQTSGDFYDFIPLDDGKLGLVVADVADKGTGAALYMALSRTLIRTHAMQLPDDPAETLRLANERILADTRANQFVTVFYGVLNLVSGEMIYCSAGHNPAFIIRAADHQKHESYIRTGPPMGIFGDLVWESGRLQVDIDDILLIYSDGVNEAQDEAEEFYGYDRLMAIPKSNGMKTAAEIHDAIVGDLRAFVGRAPQFDDITLMILKREAFENVQI
jgi:serine phosphatase RsbU (regulator of sigma subunit)